MMTLKTRNVAAAKPVIAHANLPGLREHANRLIPDAELDEEHTKALVKLAAIGA